MVVEQNVFGIIVKTHFVLKSKFEKLWRFKVFKFFSNSHF